jgi:hypothetical protein
MGFLLVGHTVIFWASAAADVELVAEQAMIS